MTQLRIATRKSPLALWQANEVSRLIQLHHPEVKVELVSMSTRGDKILDTPLAKVGGKGLFVKELELGLLQNDADLAVHSMKDVPVEFPDGLELSILLEREDPRDAFVSNDFENLETLPEGARVGTSSLRRQAQLQARFPGLKILSLRGNVNTRLKKLDDGEYDAIILACAGLKRLEMEDRIRFALPPEQSLPAIGQGVVGIETRVGDEQTLKFLKALDHAPTRARITAERAMNEKLQGGCQVPMAGYAELRDNDQLYMRGLVAEVDGSRLLQAEATGPQAEAQQIGLQVAEALLAQGAGEILAAAHV